MAKQIDKYNKFKKRRLRLGVVFFLLRIILTILAITGFVYILIAGLRAFIGGIL